MCTLARKYLSFSIVSIPLSSPLFPFPNILHTRYPDHGIFNHILVYKTLITKSLSTLQMLSPGLPSQEKNNMSNWRQLGPSGLAGR